MKLLKLLENRNQCLKKIAEKSELICSQLSLGDFSGLDSFEIWRSNAIKTLSLLDNFIVKLTKTLPDNEKNDELRTKVTKVLEKGSNHIYYIKELDIKLMQQIETEKHRLLADLAAVEQSKKTVSKFRSENIRKSGGFLDGTI